MSNNKDSLSLYIPCDNETLETTIKITLNDDNKEDNAFIITESSSQDKINIKYPLELDDPIYINNIPIVLISLNNNLPLSSLTLRKIKKNSKKIKKTHILFLSLIIIMLFSLLFLFKNYYQKNDNNPINEIVMENYKTYLGVNGHYCLYGNSPPEWIKGNNKYSYIDMNLLNTLFSVKNKKVYNLMINNDNTPQISFIFHNNKESEQIMTNIRKVFPSMCQPITRSISIPNLLKEFNKIDFIKTINYKVEEENNGIVFIFDEKIEKKNKIILDEFIKKQSAIFGRKFIFYRENRTKSQLENKAILQEDNGYIFIDSQHRYFPKG